MNNNQSLSERESIWKKRRRRNYSKMRPNKCCCCDHKIGSLILLGVCLYIAVQSVLYSVKSDHGITAFVDLFFIGFGFIIVLKEKFNLLLPTIIYLIVKSVLLAVGIFFLESKNMKIELSELNDELNELDHIKFVVNEKKIIRWTIIFLIVLYLSTALALWWYKQQLKEKALANSRIPQYQTQFTIVQPQPKQYPENLLVLPQYTQNPVLVPQYSQDPPPYPETKVNLSQ